MKKLFFFFVLIFLRQHICLAQIKKNSLNFNVDSIVTSLHIRNMHDPDALVDTLTSSFKTDSAKVRAIFYWMTQNIAYDCKAFHSGSYEVYAYKDDYDDIRIKKTLLIKKGICNDYALVFSELCRIASIKSKIIVGYALITKPYTILKILGNETTNHAWNAVMINNKWYLVDVTWASGYVDNGVLKFTKLLNDYYYLTPPAEFIKDHHPTEPNWQLLDKPLTMKEFIQNAQFKERGN
jgi:transglutaminase/protease-like cytokinesis protein 3